MGEADAEAEALVAEATRDDEAEVTAREVVAGCVAVGATEETETTTELVEASTLDEGGTVVATTEEVAGAEEPAGVVDAPPDADPLWPRQLESELS